MAIWYESDQRDKNIVVSTRIRLARNVKGMPFPAGQSNEQAEKAISLCIDAAAQGALDFSYLSMAELSPVARQALMEDHLISPDLSKGGKHAGVLLSGDRTISIMLGEEDHIRIQCILGGYALEEAFDMAQKVDDLLAEQVEYAFDDMYGYLTACPTNTGTGMRASVMLHLPAMSMTSNIESMAATVSKFGMTVRGIYGEGSEAKGDLYQISNQVTLGVSEKDILQRLKDLTDMIVKRELDTREKLLSGSEVVLKDKLMRSYGLLFHAYQMNTDEFLKLISFVRMGVYMGIITNISPSTIDTLVIALQPAHMIKENGGEMDLVQRDIKRAEHLRKMIG